MRALLWFLVLALAAVLVTLLSRVSAGYALFVAPPYRIELTLNLLLLLLFIGFVIAYLAVRLTVQTIALPQRVRAFRREQQDKRSRQRQDAAIVALFEGRYAKARQYAQEALAVPHSSGVNALIAARAAIDVRDFAAAEEALNRADAQVASLTVPRLMLEAEMQLEQGQPQEALRYLQSLRKDVGLHTAALRLQLRALQAAHRWGDIPTLLEQLIRRKVFEPEQAEQVRVTAHSEQLREFAHDAAGLRDYWNRLSEADRLQPKVARAAARSFLALGNDREAAEIAAKSLERDWNQDLVALFGECKLSDTVKQLEQAEKWLPRHNQDAVLLLILGKLCQREQLWGKAQTYLEASLALESTHSAHLALGEMLGELGKVDQANAHLAAALRLALDQLRQSAGGRRKLIL